MDRYAVIDFETTGLSVNSGARAIEIGAVIVEGGRIVDEYQNLMNPGVSVPANITQLTGISTEMIRNSPPPEVVFPEVRRFVSGSMLVAHNASFDRSFWSFELERLGFPSDERFICTMLMARRLYPWTNNHKLATLARTHTLPNDGRLHRALADSSLTAHLLLKIINDLDQLYPERVIDSRFLTKYQKTRKADARSTRRPRVQAKARPSAAPSNAKKQPASSPKTASKDPMWGTPHVKMEHVSPPKPSYKSAKRKRPPDHVSRQPVQDNEESTQQSTKSWGWLWWFIAFFALSAILRLARL